MDRPTILIFNLYSNSYISLLDHVCINLLPGVFLMPLESLGACLPDRLRCTIAFMCVLDDDCCYYLLSAVFVVIWTFF